MRVLLIGLPLVAALAGCSAQSSGATPTPIRVVAVQPRPTARLTTPTVRPTPIARSSAPYRSFVASACRAFASKDVSVLQSLLPNYQYNTGLRYGTLGDGEGQSGDPSLFAAWLTGASVRCSAFTPDQAGHGTVLTVGWKQNGGAALIDVDTFGGTWKFNDFTFGTERALREVMNGSVPVMPYSG